MVEIEEIEEIYEKDVESVEKEFLDGLKAGKSTKDLDKIYRDKIKLARDKYYKSMSDYIERSKKAKQQKKKGKKEKFKHFEVVPANLRLSWFRRMRNKLNLKWFKFHFSVRNGVRSRTPNGFLRFRIWVKLKLRRYYMFVRRIIEKIFNWFKELFVSAGKGIYTGVKKALAFLIELPGKFLGLFRRKKKGKEGEKKEGEGKEGEEKKEGEEGEKKEG
jgi:hypothetical protein